MGPGRRAFRRRATRSRAPFRPGRRQGSGPGRRSLSCPFTAARTRGRRRGSAPADRVPRASGARGPPTDVRPSSDSRRGLRNCRPPLGTHTFNARSPSLSEGGGFFTKPAQRPPWRPDRCRPRSGRRAAPRQARSPTSSRLTAGGKTHTAFDRRSIPAKQPVMKPARRSAGDPSRLTASLRAAHRCVSVEIHPGQFSRWGLLPHAPCQPRASPASALTQVPPQAVHRVAARRSSLRFGRNTPGIPPSRALSAGRLGQFSRWGPRRSRGFHHRLLAHPRLGRPRRHLADPNPGSRHAVFVP